MGQNSRDIDRTGENRKNPPPAPSGAPVDNFGSRQTSRDNYFKFKGPLDSKLSAGEITPETYWAEMRAYIDSDPLADASGARGYFNTDYGGYKNSLKVAEQDKEKQKEKDEAKAYREKTDKDFEEMMWGTGEEPTEDDYVITTDAEGNEIKTLTNVKKFGVIGVQQSVAERDLKLSGSADNVRYATADQLEKEAVITPERAAQDVGRATDITATNFQNVEQATDRGLSSVGVDPTSGKYQTIKGGLGLGKAASLAAAENDTRRALGVESENKKMTSRSLRMGVPIGLGIQNPAAAAYQAGGNQQAQIGLTQAGLSTANTNAIQGQQNFDSTLGLNWAQLGEQKRMNDFNMQGPSWKDYLVGGLINAGSTYAGVRAARG